MKCWHAALFSGDSGISKYARVFFDEILFVRDYTRLEIDQLSLQSSLDTIKDEDVVHIEIGINQVEAIELMMALLARGHKNIDVTMHDAPFLCWPLFRFKNTVVNKVSKAIHFYLRNFGYGEGLIKRLRKVYVLTERGYEAVELRYKANNVVLMPLIIGADQLVEPTMTASHNLLFFGFIGKGKGLNYTLKLHKNLLSTFPESKCLVVGKAVGKKSEKYLADMKAHYSHNVEYMGFVSDTSLRECFARTAITLLPFANYHSIVGSSYSAMMTMAMGKVLFTNPVNALPELIEDGYNGCFLTGNMIDDCDRLATLLDNPDALFSIANNSVRYLRDFHGSFVVGNAFDQCP